MIDRIRRLLYDPRVRDVPVDDPALLAIHREVLREKRLLRSAFETFYRDMASLCDRHFPVGGIELELGSGAGFFREVRPGLVTSDVRTGPHIDRVIDAQAMDLPDGSVRCVYAINVFHHLPDPEAFLRELARVLAPGGGCVLVEPHGGFASARVHRLLHSDEHFDPAAPGWRTEGIGGPLSGANQALADEVRVPRGKVVLFTDVLAEVVELRRLGGHDEFPITIHDRGSVVRPLAVEDAGGGLGCGTGQHGKDVVTVPFCIRPRLATGQSAQGRHPIGDA